MKTSTRVWGWVMTTLLLLVGVSAIITHRFVGKYGSGVMTGRSAVIVGGFVTLTAVYFSYLLLFPKRRRSDSEESVDGGK